MPVLHSRPDAFGGYVVDPESLPLSTEGFAGDLAESVDVWRSEGAKVVWLSLPTERADLVPLAVGAGFGYHHAGADGLVLTLVLIEGAYVPPYATHYIGAGGVVVNPDRELLVIQERHHTRRHLKLPGGALEPGEHIADAAVREVREETGIETEFVSLVCFRHWHGYRFGKSDIYFVTRLRPLNSAIRLDPREISECRWMAVDDYLADENTHPFNRRIVQAALSCDGGGGPLESLTLGGYGTPETHELFFPPRR